MPGHVLHVFQPAEGGVPAVALANVQAQLEAGWRVTLACPPVLTAPAGPFPPGVEHVPWVSSRLPGRSLPGEVRRLAGVIHQVDPDVVHLHSAKAGLVGRLAVRGRRPTVYQPHAWSFHAVDGVLRTATTAWERLASRWADRLLCVSCAEEAEGRAAGISGTYVVVPNGIDLERFVPASADDRAAARQQLDQPPGPLAVCIGRLARQKGQDLLLDAWAHVRELVPGARLVLVGDGPLREHLAARQVPGVELVGPSEAVPLWYAAADVVVAPSRWEGMALVPLEAAARGRSTVLSGVAGMEESLGPAAGAVVPPGDVRALAAAVAARLQDRATADAEGAAGRRFVEQRHDLRLVTRTVMDLYAEMLSASGPAA